jgi:hypothetical protein
MSYFAFSINSLNQMVISTYPADIVYVSGLTYDSYRNNTTYFTQENSLSFFTTATKTNSGTTTSINYTNAMFNTLDTFTQSSSIPIKFAFSFYGYFIPTSTGTYTFTFYGDDTLSFWLGTANQAFSTFKSGLTNSNIKNTTVITPPVTAVTPLAFTSNNFILSTVDYKSGTYTTSASSVYNDFDALAAWRGFIGVVNTAAPLNAGWVSDSERNLATRGYSSSTGLFTGTTSTPISNHATITVLKGEWLQILLPYGLVINGYNILPRNVATTDGSIPQEWYIIGSNDGTTWNIIDYRSVSITNHQALQTYTVTGQTVSYLYFRIVILKRLIGANNWVSIGRWEINGFPSAFSTYSVNLTSGIPYPMLLNYGQNSVNSSCKMGITPPPSGTLTYDGTPYFFRAG